LFFSSSIFRSRAVILSLSLFLSPPLSIPSSVTLFFCSHIPNIVCVLLSLIPLVFSLSHTHTHTIHTSLSLCCAPLVSTQVFPYEAEFRQGGRGIHWHSRVRTIRKSDCQIYGSTRTRQILESIIET